MSPPAPSRAEGPGAAAGDVVLSGPPRLGPLYARALATSRARRPAQLPAAAVVVPEVVLDGQQVARYARVCGFPVSDAAPLTFPHLLAFGAQVHLMVTRPFPLPLLGLVHLRQRITQHRPLLAGEAVRVRVRAERLAPHPRGTAVDLLAHLDVAGEPVWSGRSTYLARGAGAPGAPAAQPAGPHEPGEPDALPGPPELPEPSGPATAMWPVPADTGRRYAAVSGDVNPIHLSALSARALGFPRAIAHGMWTAARTVAALGPRVPAAATLDVAFHRPVLLPTTLALLVRPAGTATGAAPDEGGFDVAVRSRSGERLHLSGTLRPGAGRV